MQIKMQLGKISFRKPLDQTIANQQSNGVNVLPVVIDHVLGLRNLPTIHRDPFDRLLAAQAIHEGAQLITADPVFKQYPVRLLW
jgi:PIN domain nuclease of toxin-antitoxin system